MTYDGFGSRAWSERLKKARAFRLVTGDSDARPPVPVDPYGTNPDAWVDVLRAAGTLGSGPLLRANVAYTDFLAMMPEEERARYHSDVLKGLADG